MDELISQINPIKYTKTYSKPYHYATKVKPNLKSCEVNFNEDIKSDNSESKVEENDKKVLDQNECNLDPKSPLTTKDAVKYLIEGVLQEKVCRYCLNTSLELSSLDELITIAKNGTLFSVAIKQMIASFHPVKIEDDPNFPNKICQTCLDRTLKSYLFTQQCDQSERALRDCFEDMYDKVLKLDSIERTKRRGRYKLKPNYNKLHTEHKYVINYAEPTIHINSTAIQLPNEPKINDLECLKCSQVLPDTISLLNHVKSHPKSQWFNCRLCGKSFPKLFHLKKHFRQFHTTPNTNKNDDKSFKCNECGMVLENYQQFYQHKEKHKFRNVMKHLITCKMDKLCTICLDKGSHMIGINESVNLHGGFPELTGDKSVLSMVTATLPEKNYKYQELCIARNANKIIIRKKTTSKTSSDFVLSKPIILTLENIKENDDYIFIFNAPQKINEEYDIKESEAKKMRFDDENGDMPMNSCKDMNILTNHTGTKICQKCYSNILASYLFVTQTYLVRNKIDSCIALMIRTLTNIEPQKNICIEISQNFIMPEVDINIVKSEDDETKIEVLEDEFRIESGSQSEEETVKNTVESKNKDTVESISKNSVESRAKENVELTKVNSVKTKSKSKTLNGYQKDVSEFLTFKKKKPVIVKYTCPLCSKHFVSGYFLKRHILKHSNKKHFCNSCDAKLNSKFSLFEHNKIIHSKKEIDDYWTCNICERIFTKRTKFLVHRKQHSQRNCQLCNKVFRSQYHYNSHMQRHLKMLRNIKEKYIQTCSFCEKQCTNDNELSSHVNKMHLQIKPYACDMCDQHFYTENNLKCHKKLHKLYSREKCSFCNKVLNSRAKFVIHLRRHIGVKPYTCQICFEAFFSEMKLKKHLRIHLGNYFRLPSVN